MRRFAVYSFQKNIAAQEIQQMEPSSSTRATKTPISDLSRFVSLLYLKVWKNGITEEIVIISIKCPSISSLSSFYI